MRMLINLVQPAGTDGAAGFADGVPCVTPTATWLSSSPCEMSHALSHMVSMRGFDGSPAETAAVCPPLQYASVYPSALPREQTATPAATL